jgi:hypothetical protein
MPFKNPHPLYTIWQGMKYRCLNKNSKSYKDYGGRGITVCERWIHDYKTFAADMGERPEGYTLDRIDNNKGYSPENCRWASRQQQQINRNNTHKYIIDGKEVIPCLIAKNNNMKNDTIINRVKRGLSYEEIISPEKSLNMANLALGGKANGLRQKAKTHCPNGHEYTPENILKNKDGWRRCKKCHAVRASFKARIDKLIN